MLDEPHMAAPTRGFQAHMCTKLPAGLRKALRRQERIIGGIHHQRRHSDIAHAPQCRALGPVIPGIAKAMQRRRVTIIKFVKAADGIKPRNIYEIRKLFRLFLHFYLQIPKKALHVDLRLGKASISALPARSQGTE